MAKSNGKEGKEFEEDFKNSIPLSTWFYRIPDSSVSFGGGMGSRFAQESRYDYLGWNGLGDKQLYSLELKSTKESSITMCDYEKAMNYEKAISDELLFRKSIKGTQTPTQKEQIAILKANRKQLEKICKAKSIKYHQIRNLYIDSLINSQAYLILNFRTQKETYALSIQQFVQWWKNTTKKSISLSDIKSLNPILIPCSQIGRSKRMKYDVSGIGICSVDTNEYTNKCLQNNTPFLNEIVDN